MNAAALVAAFPVSAADFKLSVPIECDLRTECYIQQYVDHDPSPNASDFTCSNLTYDGHKGTDFGLRDPSLFARGVTVVAAANGRVIGRRDGVTDKSYTDADAERVKNMECGNGVVIQHENGWQTQYCHLKRGSVLVSKGESVQRGDPLGQIGISGKAAFPHLHLSVRQASRVVDPFAPNGRLKCGGELETLWDLTPAYVSGGLLNIGFSDHVPTFEDLRLGTAPVTLTTNSKAIVGYVHAFGVKRNDQLTINITGPMGFSVEKSFVLEKDQAQVTRSIGRQYTQDWVRGIYQVQVQLIRNGMATDAMEFQTIISD